VVPEWLHSHQLQQQHWHLLLLLLLLCHHQGQRAFALACSGWWPLQQLGL
jgi:hypothetical protein